MIKIVDYFDLGFQYGIFNLGLLGMSVTDNKDTQYKIFDEIVNPTQHKIWHLQNMMSYY